jgi:hypothetical protein
LVFSHSNTIKYADLSNPTGVVTLEEVFQGTSCTGTLTATATLEIRNSMFYAQQTYVTFVGDELELQVATLTWSYTSLNSPPSKMSIVCLVINVHLLF